MSVSNNIFLVGHFSFSLPPVFIRKLLLLARVSQIPWLIWEDNYGYLINITNYKKIKHCTVRLNNADKFILHGKFSWYFSLSILILSGVLIYLNSPVSRISFSTLENEKVSNATFVEEQKYGKRQRNMEIVKGLMGCWQ